jgi:hypothetical protein
LGQHQHDVPCLEKAATYAKKRRYAAVNCQLFIFDKALKDP